MGIMGITDLVCNIYSPLHMTSRELFAMFDKRQYVVLWLGY